MDEFSIFTIVCIFLLVCLANVFAFVKFQHPDDIYSTNTFKIVVILGVTLGICSILCIAVDVNNNGEDPYCTRSWGSDCGGILFGDFWKAVVVLILIFSVVLVPFSCFVHIKRMDLATARKRYLSIVKTILLSFAVFACLFLLSYFVFDRVSIPVKSYSSSFTSTQSSSISESSSVFITPSELSNAEAIEPNKRHVNLIISSNLINFITWCSWIFLSIFGGCGIISLPVICLIDWYRNFNKNKETNHDAVELDRIELMEQTDALICQVEDCLLSQEVDVQVVHLLQIQTTELESKFDRFEVSTDSYSLLFAVLSSSASCLVITSFVTQLFNYDNWIASTVAFALDSYFPILAILLLACYSVFMSISSIVGCYVLCRSAKLWSMVMPIRIGLTYMDSFLFNELVILLTIPAQINSFVTIFNGYVRYSTAAMVFGVQVRYDDYLGIFYGEGRAFISLFLLMTFLTLLVGSYRLRFPVDQKY